MRKLLASMLLVGLFAVAAMGGTTEIPPAPVGGTTEIPPASAPAPGTTEIPPASDDSGGTTEIPPLASVAVDVLTLFVTIT